MQDLADVGGQLAAGSGRISAPGDRRRLCGRPPCMIVAGVTADPVWQLLIATLEQMQSAPPWGQQFVAQDQELAAALGARPGWLEEHLLAGGIDELAARDARDPGNRSLLGYFMNLCPPGDPLMAQHPDVFRGLPATFAAMDPVLMMSVYVAARQRGSRLGPVPRQNCVRLGAHFLSRAGIAVLDRLALPTEHRDVLRALTSKQPLPDVLPAELASWSPRQIADALAEYAGTSIGELEARLHPGASSASGFLAPGESLGAVIHRDAVALARIGVSRHAIADRIDAVLDGNGAPLTHTVSVYAGYQADPFHSTVTSGLHGGRPRGARDFVIANPARGAAAVMRGGDLISVLIRRCGFFEGAVPHRVEPTHAAWVLGLAG
jgi:hypothetical protein